MAPTIDIVSIRLPGRRAARKPRVTPTVMAKAMAAKHQLQRRPDADADQLGHRLARAKRDAEVAGGDVGDVLGEALVEGIVEPHLLAHALHDGRIDRRAAVLVHARDEASRQDAEQQEDQRDDSQQGRDDVAEATSENKQHQVNVRAFNRVILLSPLGERTGEG